MDKKIISGGLYSVGLRKIKIPSIIFAALVFLSQVIIPVAESAIRLRYQNYRNVVLDAGTVMAPLAIVVTVMVPILTLVAFYAFDRRSSSDFYQSLPYTRECVFFSWMLSVLTVTAALVIGGAALGYVSRLVFVGMYIPNFSGLGLILFMYLASALFSMACMLISMSITGSFISNVVGALLIMFLPRIILAIIRALVLELTPVLSEDYSMTWMNPQYNVFLPCLMIALLGTVSALFGNSNVFAELGYSNILAASIFTLVVAIIYIVIAAVLFKRRKSETAGQSSSSRMVQHILRIALTFAISLFGTFLLVETDEPVLAIVVYAIALIVFFAYEIITTRKWSNLLKALPTLLIVIALNAGVWGVAHLSSSAVVNNQLEAEDVQSIRIISSANNYLDERSSNIDITDEDAIRIAVDALNSDLKSIKDDVYYDENYERWEQDDGTYKYEYKEGRTIVYTCKGRTIYRYVDSQNIALASALADTEEFRDAFMNLPAPIIETLELEIDRNVYRVGPESEGGFSSEASRKLLETLQAEINEIGFENWYMNFTYGDYSPITVSYKSSALGNERISVPLTGTYTPKSYAMAIELIMSGQAKDRERLNILVSHIEGESPIAGITDEYDLELSIYVDGEIYYISTYGSGYGEKSFDTGASRVALKALEKPEPGRLMEAVYYYGVENDNGYHQYYGMVLLPVPEGYEEYIQP